MKFDTAKNLVKGFLIAGVVCCVIGLIMQTNGSVASYYFVFGAVGCIVMSLFFVFTCLRCPYCNQRIIRNCLVVKSCPHCHRNLTTGEKEKKRKKSR
jgi:hypothetical protein